VSCRRAETIDLAAFTVDSRAPEWADFRDHYPRCADCSGQVAAWSRLVSGLAEVSSTPSAHPSEERLLELETRPERLGAEERRGLQTHLESCRTCRTELAVLRRFESTRLPGVAPQRRQVPLRERLVAALETLRDALVPAVSRPALALAGLGLVLVSAGALLWQIVSQVPDEVPIARVEQTESPERVAPESVASEPGPRSEVEIAKQERRDPAVPMAPIPDPEGRTQPSGETGIAAPQPEPTPGAVQVAQEPKPTTPEPEAGAEPIQIAALVPAGPPRYAPDLDDLSPYRIGGAMRGVGAPGPELQVLAPEHLGRTIQESPTLYWVLSRDSDLRIDVVITDPGAVKPVLKTTLEGPTEAGLHAVDLARLGIRLRPGVDYRWFVNLVVDPERRSSDLSAGGGVRFAAADPELRARLDAAPPAELAHVYAANGLWYDAVQQVSQWIEAEPDSSRLRSHRASLLRQVGLESAAAYEPAERGAVPR
jgi:hypothetical protein